MASTLRVFGYITLLWCGGWSIIAPATSRPILFHDTMPLYASWLAHTLVFLILVVFACIDISDSSDVVAVHYIFG